MFAMSWDGASVNNISISGCTFAGQDTPTGSNAGAYAQNYANYNGVTGGFGALMVVFGNGGEQATNINIQNNSFRDSIGDELIIYDNCGTGNFSSSYPCFNQSPSSTTEGPQHVWVANNTFQHCVEPGVHINGGSFIYVTNNTFTDCNLSQEEDPGTDQAIRGLYMYKNTMSVSSFGQFTFLGGYQNVGGFLSCLGNSGNGSGCWAVQNTLSGCASDGNCIQLAVKTPSGQMTGNYYSNILLNGAWVNPNSSSQNGQLTVPYCNGGTCDTTGWLNVPPTPN